MGSCESWSLEGHHEGNLVRSAFCKWNRQADGIAIDYINLELIRTAVITRLTLRSRKQLLDKLV